MHRLMRVAANPDNMSIESQQTRSSDNNMKATKYKSVIL